MCLLAWISYYTELRCSNRYLSVKKIQTWTLKDLWLQVTWTCRSRSLQVFPWVNPQVTHRDLDPCSALPKCNCSHHCCTNSIKGSIYPQKHQKSCSLLVHLISSSSPIWTHSLIFIRLSSNSSQVGKEIRSQPYSRLCHFVSTVTTLLAIGAAQLYVCPAHMETSQIA